jgi:hypothetical protein
MEQVRRWRARAEELRKMAEGFKSASAKEGMLTAAASLEQLATDREAWARKLSAVTTRKLPAEFVASEQPAMPEAGDGSPSR